jgi:hypothetical protein
LLCCHSGQPSYQSDEPKPTVSTWLHLWSCRFIFA